VLASPGRSLDPPARTFLERGLGHDFGAVRIHVDAPAARAAGEVGAMAFAVGRHLVFREGAYRPDSRSGRALLANELTHVVQSGGREPSLGEEIEVAPADSAAEREATRAEDRVAQGEVPTAPTFRDGGAAMLRRRLVVNDPAGNPPYGPPALRGSTHAQLVQGWLATLCPAAAAAVDSAGVVSVSDPDLCTRVAGSLDRERHEQRVLTPNRPTPPANAVSCECLCQAVSSPTTIDLNVDDTLRAPVSPGASSPPDRSVANAGGGATNLPGEGSFTVSNPTVTVSGQATTLPGSARGGRISDPPWVILAHEICGHVLSDQAHPRDLAVASEDSHAQTEEGDRSAVDVENLVRGEHGLETRRGEAVFYTLQTGDDLAGLEQRFGFVGHGSRAWRIDAGIGFHRSLAFPDHEFPAATPAQISSGQDVQLVEQALLDQVNAHNGQVLVFGAAWDVVRPGPPRDTWDRIARRWGLLPRPGQTPGQRVRDANAGVRLLLLAGLRVIIPLP
jgi:uncharacterized protein DUF4157